MRSTTPVGAFFASEGGKRFSKNSGIAAEFSKVAEMPPCKSTRKSIVPGGARGLQIRAAFPVSALSPSGFPRIPPPRSHGLHPDMENDPSGLMEDRDTLVRRASLAAVAAFAALWLYTAAHMLLVIASGAVPN